LKNSFKFYDVEVTEIHALLFPEFWDKRRKWRKLFCFFIF
jgi:hypothetical protein